MLAEVELRHETPVRLKPISFVVRELLGEGRATDELGGVVLEETKCGAFRPAHSIWGMEVNKNNKMQGVH